MKNYKNYLYYSLALFLLLAALSFSFFVGVNTTAHATEQGTVSLTVEVPSGEEEVAPAPAPSVGGGGGAVVVDEPDGFSIDKDIMRVKIKEGASFKTPIKITSLGENSQNIQINVHGLEGLITVSDKFFVLEGREERVIDVDFFSFNELDPGVYTGKITITNGKEIKEVLITFEIKSEVILFDVSLDIPEGYRELLSGEELLAQLTLFNLDDVKGANVSIEYQIKDFFGNVLYSEEENVLIDSAKVTFVRNFKISSDVEKGDYVLAVKVRYNHSFATASEIFHVVKKGINFIYVALVLIGLAILALWLRKGKNKIIRVVRRPRGEKRLQEKKEALDTSKRLKKQLSVLDKAVKGRYISEKSYSKGRKSAKRVVRKLKKKSL